METTTLRVRAGLTLMALAVSTLVSAGATAAEPFTHHIRGNATAEGAPGEEIWVTITDEDGYFIGDAFTTTGGDYDVEVVDGGPYLISFEAESYAFTQEYYDDARSRADATWVTVAGSDLDLEPVVLDRQTLVHGTVVAGGEPVSDMQVDLFAAGPTDTSSGGPVGSVHTEGDGYYELWLPSGEWKLRYAAEWEDWDTGHDYLWAPEWSGDAPSFGTATTVTTPAMSDLGTTVLTRGGAISGRVTDAPSGEPVRKVDVDVLDGDGQVVGHSVTRNDGRWTVGRLHTGAYTVRVEDRQAQAYAPSAGTPVTVVADNTTPGADIALVPVPPPDPASVDLSGVLTDQGGAPVRGALVRAFAACDSPAVSATYTDINGRYRFTDLTQAAYRLRFIDRYGLDPNVDEEDDSFELITAWFGNTPTCSSSAAVALGSLDADTTHLQHGGVTGTVVTETGDAPREGYAQLYTESDDTDYPSYSTRIHPDGTYSFGLVAPGEYELEFRDDWGDYVWTWWQDSETRAGATPVVIQPGVMLRDHHGHTWNHVSILEPPTISGTAQVGQTLTSTPGEYSGRDLTFVYEWRSGWYGNNEQVVGSAESYVVQESDVGNTIHLEVRVSGPDGQAVARSNGTDFVEAAPPGPTPPPPAPTTPPAGTSPAHASALAAKATFRPGNAPSRRRILIKVVVLTDAPAGAVGGTLTIANRRGKVVRTTGIRNGGALVRLARPREGWHRYSLTYSGTAQIAPSTAVVRVRVPASRDRLLSRTAGPAGV